MVYQGNENYVSVDVEYGEAARFRLYAENAAGKGKYSSEIVMRTPEGKPCTKLFLISSTKSSRPLDYGAY